MSRDRDSSSSSNSCSYDTDQKKSSRSTKNTSYISKPESSRERRHSPSQRRSHRSRSKSRSKSKERKKSKSNSKKRHKSKHGRAYRDKSKDLSPIAGSTSRHRRNGSHSRHTSKRSKSRGRSGKSRRQRSQSTSSQDSRSSHHSKHRRKWSSSSSDTGDRESRSGSIVKSDIRKNRKKTHLPDDITNKIAKAVEQAASSVLNKIKSVADSTDQPIKIEADILDDINSDSFTQKAFIPSNKAIVSENSSLIKEELAATSSNGSECLLHPNLIIDEATKMRNWIKNLYTIRMRSLQDS